MRIETQVPLIEEILAEWAGALGEDHQAYRNHVYRMVHFCLAFQQLTAEERERVFVAGCFHDLGIWARGTFDYLSPSIDLATDYLERRRLDSWVPEIGLMIELHHKVRKVCDPRFPLVEAFRRADLVDLSLGWVRYGLPTTYIREVRERFPNAGFHKRLVQLAAGWVRRHPLNPLPVLKW